MNYIWNKENRRYEDSRGNPVPPAKLRDYIEEYIDANKDEIEREANDLISKGASAALILIFFSFLRDKIKETHGTSGILAYGGEDEMSPERWARIGDKIATEYEYANTFEAAVLNSRQATDEILATVTSRAGSENVQAVERAILTHAPSELEGAIASALGGTEAAQAIAADVVTVTRPAFDSLIWGEVGSRGRLYADSVYGTYENSVKAREGDAGLTSARRVCVDDESSCEDCPILATEEYLPLDEVADISDSQCASRCRCWYEFNYAGVEPLTIDREVYA